MFLNVNTEKKSVPLKTRKIAQKPTAPSVTDYQNPRIKIRGGGGKPELIL